MTNFHPNFPFGKGVWIWRLSECCGGNLKLTIDKCKQNDISYVLIKCGDGENTWPQFTKEVVEAFRSQGVKVYSWSYVYGKNPIREASIAMWALDKGVDGHVFDAEAEYEKIPDPAGTAKTMLEYIRNHTNDAGVKPYEKVFLAHAPFPVIDYHQKFPYIEFGKYCDAVMPQMYWGTMKRDPENIIMWTYQQWSKWEATWKGQGHGDSVKPIIPIGQAYDNAQTNYSLKAGDIKRFIDGVAGYMSVNFWSFQHILRADCWEAIRTAQVTKPKLETTPEVKVETNSAPADVNPGVVNEKPASPPVTIVEVPKEEVTTVTTNDKKTEPELPVRVAIPQNGKTTIEVTPNADSPTGVDIKVRQHITHLDYFLMFFHYLLRLFKIEKI